ncbi:hypothetical protein EWE74_07025 [Sphingobacterium corticibacterium]|uniref:Cytoplasmic protein n=2 Tax=Sphingobacterium corticibacterium TaxID=2484746 RepID=A0A4Q6Y127_9SPHI|nr:hypothetical protein EWE74_07025 [Sphingobacterium corticibacterium]
MAYLEHAHKASSSHRAEMEDSTSCGCFYCLATFTPIEIVEWIDEPNGGETAICPKCGIDSVLSSKYPIADPIFLREMNAYWF